MAYPFDNQPQYFSSPFSGAYQPQQFYQQTQSRPIIVKGIDAARSFPLGPSGKDILWDEEEDIFYRVSANMQGIGKPNIVEVFKYTKVDEIAELKNQNDIESLLSKIDELNEKVDKLAYKPKYNKNRRDDNAEPNV